MNPWSSSHWNSCLDTPRWAFTRDFQVLFHSQAPVTAIAVMQCPIIGAHASLAELWGLVWGPLKVVGLGKSKSDLSREHKMLPGSGERETVSHLPSEIIWSIMFWHLSLGRTLIVTFRHLIIWIPLTVSEMELDNKLWSRNCSKDACNLYKKLGERCV